MDRDLERGSSCETWDEAGDGWQAEGTVSMGEL